MRKNVARGKIFDIKRFSIHDGPGIRTTVFFKGCPLHCLWCHNPEGIERGFELISRPSRCSRCYSCVSACPLGAISRNSGPVEIDRSRCDLCGKCVKVCMYEALELAGREVSVEDVIKEVEKDRIFYEQSGGGATLSGGEPLDQPKFCQEILTALEEKKIPAALDTSGLAPWDILAKNASRADIILYDLKMIDAKKHKKYTGVSNKPILDNLKKLSAVHKSIVIRIPLAAGVNDDEENVRRTIDFLKPQKTIKNVSLLKYHKGGVEKYKSLGKASCFKIYETPSEQRMEEIRQSFTKAGFTVKIGG
jgi:pyruvate formate lyase activating enzyme